MFAVMEPSSVMGSYRIVRPSANAGACDRCRHRKCDMANPCAPCTEKGFNCTFDKVRKKRGPPKKQPQLSASVSSNAEETVSPTGDSTPSEGQLDRQPPSTIDPSHHSHDRTHSNAILSDLDISSEHIRHVPLPSNMPSSNVALTTAPWDSALQSPTSVWSPLALGAEPAGQYPSEEMQIPSFPMDSPSENYHFSALPEHYSALPETDFWPSLIKEESLLPWIDVYFRRLHATIPILDPTRLYQDMILRKHRTDKEYGSMLLSLCAFAMTQPVRIEECASLPSRTVQARMMMEEAVKMRNVADFGENPTLHAVLASFFLFGCLFGANQHKAAWLRLREAVDLAYSLGLDNHMAYQNLSVEECEQWMRAYLVLSVTERAYALQRQHPIGFRGRPSINARFMQNWDSTAASQSISSLISRERSDGIAMIGLLYLMESFDAIDVDIINCWNGHCQISDGQCTIFDRRRAMQVFRTLRLARESSFAGTPSFVSGTKPLPLHSLEATQIADISITQIWLANRVWHLSLSHNLVRQESDVPELRNDFACHLAQAAMIQIRSIELQALETHGVGMIEKIYHIAVGALTSCSNTPEFDAAALDSPLSFTEIDLSLTHGKPRRSPLSLRMVIEDLQSILFEFRSGEHPYSERFIHDLSTVAGFY